MAEHDMLSPAVQNIVACGACLAQDHQYATGDYGSEKFRLKYARHFQLDMEDLIEAVQQYVTARAKDGA